ncbi:hypothetical protein HAX54_051554 [Datura stramonium]|uniref:Proline dehydrogenase n=1 Tax=Datura stramonium TaxID=4076 RepID=A0ABS8SYH5_DATST|nr:hypothetical protein [Datura stramonium]
MVIAKKAAEKMGVPMGFKLVRGAYMGSEKELASRLGFNSPIHDSLQQTHACFNSCAEFMIEEIANGSGSVVLATHNIESGFQVSKYLPFGPVEQIMQYLMRRAEENRGMLSTSAFDRQLMRKELSRRLKVATS